eukprot:g5898.t1
MAMINAQKERIGYPFGEIDIHWNGRVMSKIIPFVFLAGIVAGLIGIGGGMVLGPIMLEIGVNPMVSSSVTATNVLLSSSTVAIVFLASDLVDPLFALLYLIACFFGAYIGVKYVKQVVKRTGRQSLVVLMLAFVISCAVTASVVRGIVKFVNDVNANTVPPFNVPCQTKNQSDTATALGCGSLAANASLAASRRLSAWEF